MCAAYSTQFVHNDEIIAVDDGLILRRRDGCLKEALGGQAVDFVLIRPRKTPPAGWGGFETLGLSPQPVRSIRLGVERQRYEVHRPGSGRQRQLR